LAADDELRLLVQTKLELEWSPEQISAWLRLEHPDRRDWHVCHETIYQAIYERRRGGLSRQVAARLRTGRPLRKRRRRPLQRTPRFARPGKTIEHRPAVVEARLRIGDWEGDLIIGRHSRSAIGTLVDRRSRYLRLVHLPGRHGADELRDALFALLDQVPAAARRSLTWDQGGEMAFHDELAHLFTDGIYFAHPGRPWQRGSNENTNGLIRQYFPKMSDLSRFTADDLADVERRLNTRPRKILGWQTPDDVFHAQLPS
jgi:IS30 family transposase